MHFFRGLTKLYVVPATGRSNLIGDGAGKVEEIAYFWTLERRALLFLILLLNAYLYMQCISCSVFAYSEQIKGEQINVDP